MARGMSLIEAEELVGQLGLELADRARSGNLDGLEQADPGRQAFYLLCDELDRIVNTTRRRGSRRSALLASRPDPEVHGPPDVGPEVRVSADRELGRVEEVLAGCTERDRALFQRVVVDGEAAVEVAGSVGMSPAAVRNVVYRVRLALQGQEAPDFGGAVARVLASVSTEEQRAYTLRVRDALPVAAIAEELGWTEDGVKDAVRRIRARVRLEAAGDER